MDSETDRASSHMSGRMTTRIEVVGRVSGRRRWTVEQKLAILRDAFGPDGSVRAACDRHGVGSGAIYTWRRQAMSGELAGVRPPALPAFSEVEVADPVVRDVALPVPPRCGQIGIELPTGVSADRAARTDARRTRRRSRGRRCRQGYASRSARTAIAGPQPSAPSSTCRAADRTGGGSLQLPGLWRRPAPAG